MPSTASGITRPSTKELTDDELQKHDNLKSYQHAMVHIWRNNKPTNPSHRQVTDYTAGDVLRERPRPPGCDRYDLWTSWTKAQRRLVQSPATRCRHEVPECGAQGHRRPSSLRDAYPQRDIRGNTRRFYDAYGPARMFWIQTSPAYRARGASV